MEPATLAWADALTNDDQLARSIRWARDHAFGSIRGKLVDKGHGPWPGADRLGGRFSMVTRAGRLARVYAFVWERASVMH
jgi:hypothetical protein